MKRVLKIWFYILFIPAMVGIFLIVIAAVESEIIDFKETIPSIFLISFIVLSIMQILFFMESIVRKKEFWWSVGKLEEKEKELQKEINDMREIKTKYISEWETLRGIK